jgi:hypothetical protein
VTSVLADLFTYGYPWCGDKWILIKNLINVSSFGEPPLVTSSPPAAAFF